MENPQRTSLWKPETAGNLSILFSPIFGAWILSKNWKELKEFGKAKTAMFWAYAGIILVVISMFLDSAVSLALPYLIIWYFVECRKQAKYVKEKLNNDYDKKPWGGAALKGIGIVAVIFVLFEIGGALGGSSEKSVLEKSSVPIVNSILNEAAMQSGQNFPKCLDVKIYECFAKDHYKAKATLSNAKKIELIIIKKGDQLEVSIPE